MSFCHSKHTRKNRRKNHKQQYKCLDCRRQFLAGERLCPDHLWQLYTNGKQTTGQLAQRFGCSRKTISRHLKKAQAASTLATPQMANIIMDTTYFGANRGIMVLFDSISKQALFAAAVAQESNALYLQALRSIQEKGTIIQKLLIGAYRSLQRNPGKLFRGCIRSCRHDQNQP